MARQTPTDVVDVVIVGSGVAGLVAALVTKARGHEPLIIEKAAKVGGSSAYSAGGAWIPNNRVQARAGIEDSHHAALTYMNASIGEAGSASSPQRRAAFLREGPAMVEFLAGLGFRWHAVDGHPDYYTDRPGASIRGRALEAEIFDGRELGDWLIKLNRHPTQPPLPVHIDELGDVVMATRTRRGITTMLKLVLGRYLGMRLRGQIPLALGRAMVGRLLKLVLDHGIELRLETALRDLVVEGERVTGVIVEHAGELRELSARRGVLLAAGGFARNAERRRSYQAAPIGDEWTAVPPEDTGDAIWAGMAIGADTALLDDAWWIPTVHGPDGQMIFLLWERSVPHCMIVDGDGRRFMNESASYVDCVHRQYDHDRDASAIPAWLIMDSRHRRRYPFGSLLPGITPKSALRSTPFIKAGSLRELAAKIGVDAAALLDTAARFNEFARTGVDVDFGRGATTYDHVWGDPRNRPNPNLGAVARPPFYAAAVYPGDVGTKGGLLTDERGRVLRGDGEPIDGLYAAGNTSASVMGRTYPGPGATLGAAAVFGYVAACDLTSDVRLASPRSPQRSAR